MSYGMDGWNKPGGDLISIQDAIDLLDEQIAICNRALTNPSISMNDEFAVNVERNSLMAYRDKLECMPSAQPERKKGKWHQRFYSKVEMMVCSECGNEFSYDAETGLRDYNFCPNCGADMREDEQE